MYPISVKLFGKSCRSNTIDVDLRLSQKAKYLCSSKELETLIRGDPFYICRPEDSCIPGEIKEIKRDRRSKGFIIILPNSCVRSVSWADIREG